MSPDKFRWAIYYNALPTPLKYEARPPQASNSRPHIDLKSETDSVYDSQWVRSIGRTSVRLSPKRVSTLSEDATVTAAPPGRHRASRMVRALDGTAESTR